MHQVFNLDKYRQESLEPLGTKAKFWFKHDERGWCLCKIARANTGEHWSEVIASGLAEMLQIPHAEYFLAAYRNQPAVFTPTIIPGNGSLILGNQLLSLVDPAYVSSTSRRFKQTSHTISIVLETLKITKPPSGSKYPDGIRTGADVFPAYLLLDALIGNTDRHHENWGIIGTREESNTVVQLAPTFDHASSLGCHETEQNKSQRLATTDLNFTAEAYASRAKSAFYADQQTTTPLPTIDAFRRAFQLNPSASIIWLDIIDKVEMRALMSVIEAIPASVMSDASRRFAARLLSANRKAILKKF